MRILLIEDEIKLQKQISQQLEADGYMVDTCDNGEEGLYIASEYPLDAAIIDIGLPGLSGLEVIATLRKRGSLLPILILTARNSWQDKVKGFEKLATKPKNAAIIAIDKKYPELTKSFRNFGNVDVEELRTINPVSLLSHKYLVISNPKESLKIFK